MKKESIDIVLKLLEEKNNKILEHITLHDLNSILEEVEDYETEILAQHDEITKQAELIAKFNLKLDTLFNDAPIPYFVINEDFKVLKSNRAFQETFNKNMALFLTSSQAGSGFTNG